MQPVKDTRVPGEIFKSLAAKCGGAIRRLRGHPAQSVQAQISSIKLGSEYGGYVVCPLGLTAESIVYSFGVGEDVSFDLGMIERFDCTVHAFDPTPRSIEWVKGQQLPSKFVLHDYGLAAIDGKAWFTPPVNPEHVSHSLLQQNTTRGSFEFSVRRLDTIQRELGHSRVDVLKLDIEGAEYEVIDDLVEGTLRPAQILLEFHHHLPSVALSRTERAIAQLNRAGYRIFAVAETGREFSFIRAALERGS
jgi:FkbM family methyltransferase